MADAQQQQQQQGEEQQEHMYTCLSCSIAFLSPEDQSAYSLPPR